MVERLLIVCTKGARGVLPYVIYIGMYHSKVSGFCSVLILKQVQILSILICNRVWFTKELQCVWMCSSFQFLMSKKESLICEFEMDFKKSFCWRSNLSNGDIISVLCKHECYVL